MPQKQETKRDGRKEKLIVECIHEIVENSIGEIDPETKTEFKKTLYKSKIWDKIDIEIYEEADKKFIHRDKLSKDEFDRIKGVKNK